MLVSLYAREPRDKRCTRLGDIPSVSMCTGAVSAPVRFASASLTYNRLRGLLLGRASTVVQFNSFLYPHKGGLA
jgi:hypothetical protein